MVLLVSLPRRCASQERTLSVLCYCIFSPALSMGNLLPHPHCPVFSFLLSFLPLLPSIYLLFFLLRSFTVPFLPLASMKFPLRPGAPTQHKDGSACPAASAPVCTTTLSWVTHRKGEGVQFWGYSPRATIFPSWGMPRHPLINSSGCC